MTRQEIFQQLYHGETVYPPPLEEHSALLEVTRGCSWAEKASVNAAFPCQRSPANTDKNTARTPPRARWRFRISKMRTRQHLHRMFL